MFDGVGIPCGHNPVVLGSIVDENTCVGGEMTSVLRGDIMFSGLDKVAIFTEGNVLRLADLYNNYKDSLSEGKHLYVVVTNALNGTIYACGHSKRGEWTVFAKTAGYA